MPQHTALIALGANLGDSSKSLLLALEMLSNDPEIRSIRASSIHQTAPVTAEEGQSTYANAAAALETRLSPHELIQKLRKVESDFGRIRDKVWSSRTLDLDIVGFDSLVMFDEELAIPHPRMTKIKEVQKNTCKRKDINDSREQRTVKSTKLREK